MTDSEANIAGASNGPFMILVKNYELIIQLDNMAGNVVLLQIGLDYIHGVGKCIVGLR